MPETLLLRANATPTSGAGHVMRCIALGQAWIRAGGEAVLRTNQPTLPDVSGPQVQVDQVSAVVQLGSPADGTLTAIRARELGAKAVVYDGYKFGDLFKQEIIKKELKTVRINDYGHSTNGFNADILVDHSAGARTAYSHLWSTPPGNVRLLGPRYALLRDEFRLFNKWTRPKREARNILVTLGCSAACNIHFQVAAAVSNVLTQVPRTKARFILPESNSVVQSIRQVPVENCVVLVGTDTMAGHMEWADVAVTAGGGTLLETAYMQLPTLAVILAENQRLGASAAEAAGVCKVLGYHKDVTVSMVEAALRDLFLDKIGHTLMANAGRKLVDGQGAARVVSAISSLTGQTLSAI